MPRHDYSTALRAVASADLLGNDDNRELVGIVAARQTQPLANGRAVVEYKPSPPPRSRNPDLSEDEVSMPLEPGREYVVASEGEC
jgi:hypothetical protein